VTGALWRHRHIRARVVMGAAIVSVVFLPWIIPGAGVLVLTIARGIAYQGASRAPNPTAAGAAGSAVP
jgi:hypothetical protein